MNAVDDGRRVRRSTRLILAGATALCGAQLACTPKATLISLDGAACYELRRAAGSADSTDWPGFASAVLRLDPDFVIAMSGQRMPADARIARWLEWKHTPESEEAMINAMARLDELEGRDPVIAPRDSLLRRVRMRLHERLERERSLRYWQIVGQDSLVIVEQARNFSAEIRLHIAGDNGATGIARFRYEPGLPHPSAAFSFQVGVIGSRVVCPH